ncbi:MAG: helix-turn-helix domain-containing protein [archaeon YNP-WB-062]|nr:helix-turn-helix domain-containing protein [Candidatus Culexarchaeum yellowstonense]
MAKHNRKPRINVDELIKLYNEGLNDREIAMRMGVTPAKVRYWRIKLNLPSKHRCKLKVDVNRIIELRSKGYPMHRIARELGVSYGTIEYWFHKLKIKPLRVRRVRRIDRMQLVKLYFDGLTYGEIADRLGISPYTVGAIVSKLGIAYRRKGSDERRIEVKNEILRLIDENVYVTVNDVVDKLKVKKNYAINCIRELYREGRIECFRITRRASSTRYNVYDFFGRLIGDSRILYYVDERKFMEKLSRIVTIRNMSMAKSFTRLLHDNKISDENIRYFYSLVWRNDKGERER